MSRLEGFQPAQIMNEGNHDISEGVLAPSSPAPFGLDAEVQAVKQAQYSSLSQSPASLSEFVGNSLNRGVSRRTVLKTAAGLTLGAVTGAQIFGRDQGVSAAEAIKLELPSASGVTDSIAEAMEIPDEQLTTMFEQLGPVFNFGSDLKPHVPVMNFPELGEETLHYLADAADPSKGFFTFGNSSEVRNLPPVGTDTSGDKTFGRWHESIGKFITYSIATVETSQGEVDVALMHLLKAFGKDGMRTKVPVVMRLGWFGNENFATRKPSYLSVDVAGANPDALQSGGRIQPVEEVLQALIAGADSQLLKIQEGLGDKWTASLEGDVEDVRYPKDFFTQKFMAANERATVRDSEDEQAISLILAREQGATLYKGRDAVEITEAHAGELSLEERVARLARSEVYDKPRLSLAQLSRIPVAQAIVAFTSHDQLIKKIG